MQGRKTRVPLEKIEQRNYIKWMALQFPNELVFHVPNELVRSPAQALAMSLLGVRSGIPDLFICRPTKKYAGLFLEMKRKKGGSVSVSQQKILDYLNSVGYCARVAFGFEHAMLITNEYFLDKNCE